jgi:predicted RNA-binding Zn-ribbon protein involved in translation (DUF1610 family)
MSDLLFYGIKKCLSSQAVALFPSSIFSTRRSAPCPAIRYRGGPSPPGGKREMKKVKYCCVDHRMLFENLALPVPLLIIGTFILFRWEKADLLFWIASLVFIVGSLGFLFWKHRRLGLFRCPRCGKVITETRIKNPERAEPMNYYCSQCDTEWEIDCLFFPAEGNR